MIIPSSRLRADLSISIYKNGIVLVQAANNDLQKFDYLFLTLKEWVDNPRSQQHNNAQLASLTNTNRTNLDSVPPRDPQDLQHSEARRHYLDRRHSGGEYDRGL